MVEIMESLRARRVLVTGHTGFKGSWLVALLRRLGADVYGFALDPRPEAELLFQSVSENLSGEVRGDIRSRGEVEQAVSEFRPDFVFHLAAQPLVLASYADPLLTFETNVMGTANLLDVLRSKAPDAVSVVVTTDKVYANDESGRLFSESDALGGSDPYSASKAGAEHVAASYHRSYLKAGAVSGKIATARGGNVIGGGDYAENRLVPDIVRAFSAGREAEIRNPASIRPWQHVLDCLWGYLTLGAWMDSELGDREEPQSFNFGPDSESFRCVGDVVSCALKHWPGGHVHAPDENQHHEAGVLKLDTSRARSVLGWAPLWSFEEAVGHTISWYRQVFEEPENAGELVSSQIDDFLRRANANMEKR